MAAFGREALHVRLYHHVVLPRNVPGREDNNLYDIEMELVKRLTNAVKFLVPHAPFEDLSCMDAIRLALSTCSALNVDGKIDRTMLIKELRQLQSQQVLILYVTEQNAALLIYYHTNDDGVRSVVFEAFETSATCEQVLASENALQWDFPGQAVAIPYDTFSTDDFQNSLSIFLEQASLECITRFAAITHKACAPQPEIRDTPEPTLVTGALMTILEVNGAVHDTPLLRKRVRDTVSFDKAHKPWRRSAFYLAVRVGIQRHLYKILGAENGRMYYKVIMCIFLSQLLDDGLHVIPNEASHFLRQKLGRRLAKLELDRDRGSNSVKQLHQQIFRTLRPVMEKSISSATQLLESQWEAHKRRTSRLIWPIQQHAHISDMTLRLPHSGQYLHRAMKLRFSTAQTEIRSPSELLGHYESTTALKPFIVVMNRYLSLCAYEEVLEILDTVDELSDEAWCIRFARKIEAYVSIAENAYNDYPEFRSRQLLTLLDLWMAMDRYAVKCYPLLGQYHPGFDATMLDVLQLSTLEEYKRVHDLQLYIAMRCQGWHGKGSKTIFDTPAEDSFAVRYYNESDEAELFAECREEIEEDAAENLDAKEVEWEEKSEAHEAKIQEMAGLSCIYITEVDEQGITNQVHKKPCRKHKLKWEAKQMEIEISEYPLPKPEPALKAVVFELMCPKTFAAYRDATWLILNTYGFPNQTPVDEVPLLRAYSGLKDYANDTISKVTLGSSTKSHLESHYATSKFPVKFEHVCRPFGLKLDYYDNDGKTFMMRQEQPSFVHLFPMKLPLGSPYQLFENVNNSWPTSNQVLARQTRCPPDVNVHEYMAWQGLLIGTHSRWPSLLREMGSTNLSFSTDSTWALVSRLLLEVGPAIPGDLLRDIHTVLNDVTFCRRLLEQVEYRLEAVRRNWREPVQLDILISMLLKIMALNSSARIRSVVMRLLSETRTITQGWCVNLQSAEHEHGSGPSIFAIWSAVLCKRTFYPSLEKINTISRQVLIDFIVASITLQNCLVGEFNTLPYNLRNAVLRDLRHAFSIRGQLANALRTEEKLLLDVLKVFWPVPAGCMNYPITMYINTDSWWASMTLSTSYAAEHYVHYNIVHGTLLINGQQLGVLPPEYRRWPIVQKLFGSQGLKILPSGLPGMSLVVDRQMPSDHWVHLGFRDKNLVIRADQKGTILELVPPFYFHNEYQYDLPAALIDNCYHWLNLTTGVVEIRQQDPWKSKKSNWRLNLTTSQATRNNGSTLVDPNSELARKVVQNFHHFEHPHQITVYQPPRGKLRVELKRLELDFVVMHNGLLLCPQLGAVIAETRLQDVGTWYGLKSKLVVRSIKEPTQRSILLPQGDIVCQREGSHVSILIKNEGSYLKFGVNSVLGRIDCPAEPIMLYHRALWHAQTSHFLPDTLTKRTGVDEALYHLQSGAYRPWTPLSADACELLLKMVKLSPARVYYPTTLKVMESVQWNPDLPITIQDDRYRRAVQEILKRNVELTEFALMSAARASPIMNIRGDTHLENRALSRIGVNSFRHDGIYKSRDRRTIGPEHANVAVMASLFSKWPSEIPNTTRLATLLETMPVIGGYVRIFDKIQITDILNTDLAIDWGALVKTSLELSHNKRFQLTFLFALLSFTSNADMDLLHAIASFSLLPDLKGLWLPEVAAYSRFQSHETPKVDSLITSMRGAIRPFAAEKTVPIGQLLMRQLDHEKEATRACKLFAESVCAQWPSKVLDSERLAIVKETLLDPDEALSLMLPVWNRLIDNLLFSQHIDEVQLVLSRHSPEIQGPSMPLTLSEPRQSQLYPLNMRGGETPSLEDILGKDLSTLNHVLANGKHNGPTSSILAHVTNEYHPVPKPFKAAKKHVVPTNVRELERLVAPFRLSQSMVHKRYGAELEHSISALSSHLSKPDAPHEPFNPTKLANDLYIAREYFHKVLEQIRHALQRGDSRAKWLNAVGMWPKVTPVTLLAALRTTSGVHFGLGVKEALVNLGLAITTYQRLLRLQDAIQKSRQQQMIDERDNIGHTNWSPMNYVDWLLLEIEGNIMIRPEQVDVALATISPESQQNSVLQLLMGKGKTSCILPMVALVLANKNLFRIVVPRPLLLQSAQIMQAKLGGLLNREVIHIPFSRKTPTNKALMQTYCQLHSYIQKHNGIILALPEHILSFKLSGLQRLCDGKYEEASMMIKAQAWLDRHARDVLDECDVSLAIRTQLIYPSGSQQTVDGHPLRWQTIQLLLDLIASYLDDLTQKYPHSIEVVRRAGFPLIYFLRMDVQEYLIGQIVLQISRGQTAILPVGEFSTSSQQDIRDFISVPSVRTDVTARIVELFKEKRHLVDVVYHLRGLFVHRILLSTLKKRWNVQYGLHPTRDPIAVPYQAKGVPSPTAEWGHPDVAIILTCLSFYYEGLSMRQFKQAIEHLAKSDEPSIEYSLWVAEAVPEAFKNYNAVNVEDSQQLRELHYHIRHKVCLLDFYLNSFVFPQHAKQFSKKLSASGSDLILYDAMNPSCRTTGFSGTNDSRHQLPMTIKQNDLRQLAHTNAEVLAYLLEDRNRRYVRMVDHFRKRLSEDGLLRKLFNPGTYGKPESRIRILIDAGAQILEYDNRSLVKAWLKEDHEAVAAVYFDDDHRARVIYGKGTDIPLVASPFAENLEECLVYIDESHCRGTDLKLPPNARAAVTLGPHLTKDALAQAAMRLRLLGKTQSVTFFSPPEVHQSILDLRAATKGGSRSDLSSVDVIRWLLEQTCIGIEQLEPLYFNQCLNYLQRTQAKIEYPKFLEDVESRDAYLSHIRSKELHSLQQLYEPKHQQRGPAVKPSTFDPCLRTFVSEALERRKGFQDRGFAIHSSALEEVEQEREMEFEVEAVREVQPPIHFKALRVTKLHRDLEEFSVTGRLPAGSDAFRPMFYALQQTAVGIRHSTITATGTAARLHVSTQFTRTVSINEPNDNFLRPCHWILWSQKSEIGVLVSPEEADALIPILRYASVDEPRCHLISYSAPITRRMLQFNNLTYYAIPPLPNTFKAPNWLKVELGIFAGRLYFEWDEYEEIMSYLGSQVPKEEGEECVQSDRKEAFATKPLAFLHEWLAVRRKGQDFEHTPMGFITTGKPLSADHPFFSAVTKEEDVDGKLHSAPARVMELEDEGDESDDDEDSAKEHLFQHNDGDDEQDGDVFHDAEEAYHDEGNTFFDDGVFVDAPDKPEQDE